jgi:hypothetical protein
MQGADFTRVYFDSDFVPSQKCINLMETVAEGIEGIVAVIPVTDSKTNFALVLDNGVHIDVTTALWVTAFRKAANGVHKHERTDLISTRPHVVEDPQRTLIEMYSDDYAVR